MTRKQKRFAVIFSGLVLLAGAATLVLSALSEQITYFRTPTDLADQTIESNGRIRLGGLVAQGSVENLGDGQIRFSVEDANETISVSYKGILPDLFREGQGVITEGVLVGDGTFRADTVLAKHDENYMPKEVADALKEQGVWQGEETSSQ